MKFLRRHIIVSCIVSVYIGGFVGLNLKPTTMWYPLNVEPGISYGWPREIYMFPKEYCMLRPMQPGKLDYGYSHLGGGAISFEHILMNGVYGSLYGLVVFGVAFAIELLVRQIAAWYAKRRDNAHSPP